MMPVCDVPLHAGPAGPCNPNTMVREQAFGVANRLTRRGKPLAQMGDKATFDQVDDLVS